MDLNDLNDYGRFEVETQIAYGDIFAEELAKLRDKFLDDVFHLAKQHHYPSWFVDTNVAFDIVGKHISEHIGSLDEFPTAVDNYRRDYEDRMKLWYNASRGK